MMKIYCSASDKYRKIKNPKIYMLKKASGLSIVHSKCGHEYKHI